MSTLLVILAAESTEDEGGINCEELSIQVAAQAEIIVKMMKKISELEKNNGANTEGIPSFMNDTNLEERVQALEFQMTNVHDDIENIESGVSNIEEEITNMEEQFTFVLEGQLFQDQRLLDLEDERETLGSSITDLQAFDLNLEESVISLEQTDEELETAVNKLDSCVTELESLNRTSDDVADELNDLDTRLSKLELGGTVAFHVDLPSSSVPSGGAGLYYFYMHLEINPDEAARMYLRHNGFVANLQEG